jgi:hypothetical protein
MNPFSDFNSMGAFPSLDYDKSTTNEKPAQSFIDTLKSITQIWKDGYKQVSLKDFTIAKTEKAPPPADLFANLPTATNFTIGTPLFTNLTSLQ